MKYTFINSFLSKNLIFQFHGKISKKIPFWWVQMMTQGFTLAHSVIFPCHPTTTPKSLPPLPLLLFRGSGSTLPFISERTHLFQGRQRHRRMLSQAAAHAHFSQGRLARFSGRGSDTSLGGLARIFCRGGCCADGRSLRRPRTHFLQGRLARFSGRGSKQQGRTADAISFHFHYP